MAEAAAIGIECPACHTVMSVTCALEIDGRDDDLMRVSLHPDLTVVRDHAREHEADHG